MLRRLTTFAVVAWIVRLIRTPPPGDPRRVAAAAPAQPDGATTPPSPPPEQAIAGAGRIATASRTSRSVALVANAWRSGARDQLSLLSAGVAFYSFMSLFPALIAAIMMYSLVADPATIRSHARELADAVPASARQLVLDQVTALTQTSTGSLSVGLVVSLFVALWSASSAMGNLMGALNVAYRVEDGRGLVRRKTIALILTLGLIVVGLAAVSLVAVAPALFDALDLGTGARALLEAGRWVVLVVGVTVGLAVLYRVAPDRRQPERWVSVGAAVGAVIWLIASVGFSFYVDNFGSYGRTYGSLASVAILLVWMWLSFFIMLLGARINAEIDPSPTI